MLLDIIYYSSYLFVLFVFIGLYQDVKRDATDVLFIVGVILIPIGKLFYLPIASLPSVKAAFIYTSVVGGLSLLISFLKGVERYIFLPFLFMIPAMFSTLFLLPAGLESFFSAGEAGEVGTTFQRLISMLATSIYCAYAINYISTHERGVKDTATYYVVATLFATFIGAFIFYGLFTFQLTASEIVPVSVEEVHVIGRIYRFNPGANVNEFGQIVGYALLMLRWTGWKTVPKIIAGGILFAAEFLGLTRGAWVGLIVGYFVYALFTERRQRIGLLIAAVVAISLLVVVALSSPDLTMLLLSRTSLVAGAGGEDRLNTTALVFRSLSDSPWRMIFGYGWATNGASSPEYAGIDIHSVPLMVIYYAGAFGFIAYLGIFFVVARMLIENVRKDLDIVMGLLAYMFTVSLFEHNFYHVQTWLIVALVLAMGLRSAKSARIASVKLALPQ